MEAITFPETDDTCIIIRSNEKGTGFMRNVYEKRILKPHIGESEFIRVLDRASSLIQEVYSNKRRLDTQGTPFRIRMGMILSVVFGFLFCVSAYY